MISLKGGHRRIPTPDVASFNTIAGVRGDNRDEGPMVIE